MRLFVTAALASVALAACSSSDDADTDGDGSVSADEVKAAAARVTPLQPGQYKMGMELVELVDPSMSEEEIAQARQFMGAMSGMAPPRCIGEDEANKGMVGVAEQMQSGECTMDSLTSNAQGMQAEMSCKGGSGEAKVSLTSTSTGTESQMTMTAIESSPQGEKKVTMKVSMTRTGDCT